MPMKAIVVVVVFGVSENAGSGFRGSSDCFKVSYVMDCNTYKHRKTTH